MRISDWSSDVCSSDLVLRSARPMEVVGDADARPMGSFPRPAASVTDVGTAGQRQRAFGQSDCRTLGKPHRSLRAARYVASAVGCYRRDATLVGRHLAGAAVRAAVRHGYLATRLAGGRYTTLGLADDWAGCAVDVISVRCAGACARTGSPRAVGVSDRKSVV